MFLPAMTAARRLLPTAHTGFTFVINGTPIETGSVEAMALSPAVALQLSVDACSRTFAVCDGRIGFDAVRLFRCFLSGESAVTSPSATGGLSCLMGWLGNSSLELYFLSRRGVCRPLSEAISLLSVEALDSLLTDFVFGTGTGIEGEGWLLSTLVGCGSDYFQLLHHIRWDFLSVSEIVSILSANPGIAIPPESLWQAIGDGRGRFFAPPHPFQCQCQCQSGITSLIVADIPALLAEFNGKHFSLLWRGSRDGFGARDFHLRCDGRAPTLTLIEDTKGNIFGGFTPVEWESDWKDKADPSLKSFVFSLKNPHNFPARKCALKADKQDRAIRCNSDTGPIFIGGFVVSDHCNANSGSHTGAFGYNYANDTGLDGETVLTGAEKFTVKEIEVFAIGD
jgi:hypothetical protein